MCSYNFTKENFAQILNFFYDGVWITDGSGKVLFINDAICELMNVNRDDILDKSTQSLLSNKLFSDSVILDVIKHKKVCSKVSVNYNSDLTVLATATPILDEDGEIMFIVNNVRNISQIKKFQDEVVKKETLLAKKNEEIKLLKIKLGNEDIIGVNQKYIDTLQLAQRVAKFDESTVLILGESGTGKEVIAETIVQNSKRKNKPFIKVNCGAIPEQLLESELFGYEKGAFTGANSKGKIGLFEAANEGTILLDEIGDLPIQLQVKLLRALQQKQIFRIGSSKPISLNIRILASTHRHLDKMVAEGKFREDLYYRLNVVNINIPPLRERVEDIIPLVNFYLKKFNSKYDINKHIDQNTFYYFENYPWPGNIRELENIIENLVITSHDDCITKFDLPDKFFTQTSDESSIKSDKIIPLKDAVHLVEKNLINTAIEKYGSCRKAAKVLGVNPSTIVRKLQSYKEEASHH